MQRLLGTPATADIIALARALVRVVGDGGNALVTGPLGTGKSAVLHEVETVLAAAGVEVVHGPATDVGVPSDSAVLLLDHLEHASDDVLHTLESHPGGIVAMFESGRHQRAYSVGVLNAVYGARPLGRDADSVHRFHLDLLTDAEMARFLHQNSRHRLDSSAIAAVTMLAMGRRSWALDLVQLFTEHHVQIDPYPTISSLLTPGESPLPALQRVRLAVGTMSSDCAAAAVALSEIDPLDELGLGALVDAGVVETLTSAGVLVPLDQSQNLTVPGFVAAALRQQGPLDLVEQWRQRIAEGLLAQERLGLPLSERDTVFCVRAWGTAGAVDDEFAEVHCELVTRVVSSLTTFGTPAQIRTAVLAFATHKMELPTLPRARAMAALGNAAEAILVLDATTDHHFPARLSTAVVRHVLAGQTGLDPAEVDDGDLDPSAVLVLRLWDQVEPLGDAVSQVRRVADEHPDPLVATLAALLVDLDAVWGGLVPPYSSSVHAPRPLPTARLSSSREASDATNLALVAQAFILLLAGESAARRDALLDVARRLPDRDYHERWLRHVVATATAATFGEMSRALTEWRLFCESAPRMLPRRLRHQIERVAVALAAVADPTTAPDDVGALVDELPYRVSLYFAGLHGPLQSFRADLESKPGTLALVRLARAHLDAASDRNPAQLVRIAEHFEKYEMWLPSAYALSDARRIYLGRRAVGKVRECDAALVRVREEIERQAPWRDPDLDDLAVSLTPRELVAAQLAAQGMRNRDIAEQLECGVRTVESHIAQARAKLGAATREDLARLLPLVDPI